MPGLNKNSGLKISGGAWGLDVGLEVTEPDKLVCAHSGCFNLHIKHHTTRYSLVLGVVIHRHSHQAQGVKF